MSALGKKFVFFLKSLGGFLIILIPTILDLILGVFSISDQVEEEKIKEEDEIRDKIHINWKGEYSGEDDWNKY